MYLHLWNTWTDNESSQIEEVDFRSNDIYIYFSLFLFLWVCMCMLLSLFFVCIALLLPFVLGFCLSVFFFFFRFFYFKIYFFLIIIFYFNNFVLFYFILFYLLLSFVLSFLTFILSRVEDRLLVLQPGVRAVPLRWESQVKDTGPQGTSQFHIMSNGKNLPEISISMPRPSSTEQPASYSAGHPMPNK